MNKFSTLRTILMAGMMLIGLSCFADDTCDYFIEIIEYEGSNEVQGGIRRVMIAH